MNEQLRKELAERYSKPYIDGEENAMRIAEICRELETNQ